MLKRNMFQHIENNGFLSIHMLS